MAEQVGPTIEAAKKLNEPTKIEYNYKAARSAGLTDADIADYLASEVGDYDINAARAAGVTDIDIITELSTVKDEPVAAFSRGVARGGSQSAGMTTGGVLGFQAGMTIAPAFGPFAPVVPVVTTTVGGLTGLVLAEGLNQFFIPDDQYVNIGAEAGGETFGGAVTPLPVPYAAAAKAPALNSAMFISDFVKKQTGKSIGVTPLEKTLATVQRAPKSFGAFELGAAGSAAVAGGASEESDPGNVLQRMGGEMIAAVAFNPMNLLSKAVEPTKTGLANIINRFSPDTRQHQLGAKIIAALEENGEDPQALLAALREINAGETTTLESVARQTGVEPGKISTAARVMSPVLGQIEAALKKNARVGPTMENAAIKNLEAATQAIDLLYKMDDPEAMALAADLQMSVYESMLQMRLNQAEAKALETAGKAFDGTQEGAAKAGEIIKNLTKSVLTEARDQERALYAKVDRKQPATSENIAAAYDEIQADILPESPFPALITKFVNRVTGRDAVEESGFVAAEKEISDELIVLRQKADNKLDKIRDFEQKFPLVYDRVEGALDYGVSMAQVISEIKSDPSSSFDIVIRDLSRIADEYREKGGGFATGSDLDATTRKRVASYAEKMIDFLQSEQKYMDLQAYKSRSSERLAEFEATRDAPDVLAPDVTVGDLANFRSEMLAMARDARAAGQFRDANFFGRMAEAALDDLGLKAEIPDGQMPEKNQMALKAAYNYSRSLNDVFTRAFASDVLGKNKTGAEKIPPELLADKVLGGSANATNLKLLQLQDMAKFMAVNAGDDFAESAAKNLETVTGASETILRTAVAKFYNPETGRVNQNGLNAWIRQNAEILDKFPSLRDDLSDAVTADKILRDVVEENSIFSKNLKQQLAFGAFLGKDETPGNAIGEMIGIDGQRPDTPVKNLEAAMRASRLAGGDVMNGFKSALMDHAFTTAGGTDGQLSMKAYRDYFLKPMGRGLPNVMSIMRKHNMMDDVEAGRFNKLLNELVFIEDKLVKAKGMEVPIEDMPPALYDLAVRVIGAREGSRVNRMLGVGGNIQIPGAFAQYARNKFVLMPKGYFPDLLVEAAQNPKMMEVLLEKGINGRGANAQMRYNRQLNSALVNAGFIPAEEEIEQIDLVPTGIPLVRPAAAATMPAPEEIENYIQRTQTPAPRAATSPVPAPAPAPKPAISQTPSGAGTNYRRSYATMFPNDPISNLIKEREAAQTGGIGSLMP